MNDEPTSSAKRLSDFIRINLETILEQWEQFASGIPSARFMNTAALRDHAGGILCAIAADLEHAQTESERVEKAKGRAPRSVTETQAELHGAERALGGFSVNDAIAEFRALRASVLQLWGDKNKAAPPISTEELIRFNEAIDQALAESLLRYAVDKDEYTRRFDTLLSSSPDLQYIIGVDGNVIYANDALKNLYGTSGEPVIGKNIADLCSAFGPRLAPDVARVIETRAPYRGEVPCTPPSGPEVTYRYVLMPVINADGKVESIAGIARNITELKESEEKIYRNAYYDSLTDLPNRRLFHDRLDQDVRHAARTRNALALLFIDLDGFKEVNDRWGHAAGDQLLQECARRIGACVRSTDTVARIGGDEFTVILTEVNKILHVEILAQEILDELARPFTMQAKDVYISGSIGITLYPQDACTPDDLIRNADQAMYVAKHAGRNRFSFFTVEMRDSAWARLKVIDELRHALARHQLSVYYQPIVDLSTEGIVKAEALVRWRHPQGGLVLPGDFIGLAEETGLIGDIDTWVMGEAVARARQWSALTGSQFQISVNKSPVGFMNKTIMKNWDADLALLGLAGDQIAVEITEGILLNDSPGVMERLNKLQQTGVQFSIDDFGIGYSSMAYLKKFKVDYLKIDQSFVKDILTSADSGIFVETIVVMAHKLGLKVIAEGVESVEQRDWLKAVGCDYAQGFLFSEAASPEGFEKLLGMRTLSPVPLESLRERTAST